MSSEPSGGSGGPGGPADPEASLLPAPPVPVPDGVPVSALVDLTPPEQVARAALNRAKAAARARGLRPGEAPRRRSALEVQTGTSGAGPRDPQLVASTLNHLLDLNGMRTQVQVGGVMGRWAQIVDGPVAEHSEPVSFEAGVLTLRADSTGWATQLKILTPSLLRLIAEEVGEGVVLEVTVLGPGGKGFGRGPRSAKGGRGVRDTFG
ncbi:DUF721 domain-containing protein [Cellulomonas soli]|uniref:DUF721 domain-containing protein n=1 Tax=Cellulomonas soli TaxID=931535 RepID=UPI003F83956D